MANIKFYGLQLKTGKVIIRQMIKSPKGWHIITEPFDTREICKLDYVTLLRDGYYYIKMVD